jgi:hypothetical protein
MCKIESDHVRVLQQTQGPAWTDGFFPLLYQVLILLGIFANPDFSQTGSVEFHSARHPGAIVHLLSGLTFHSSKTLDKFSYRFVGRANATS